MQWSEEGGTGEVGVGLGSDVGEGAERVGAEEEVVLHEHEVPPQSSRRAQHRHHRSRLPLNARRHTGALTTLCGDVGHGRLNEAEAIRVHAGRRRGARPVEGRVLARAVVDDHHCDARVEGVIGAHGELLRDGAEGLLEVVVPPLARDRGDPDRQPPPPSPPRL